MIWRAACLSEKRSEIGALGPLVLNEDGSVQISYGGMLSFRAELLQKLSEKEENLANRRRGRGRHRGRAVSGMSKGGERAMER